MLMTGGSRDIENGTPMPAVGRRGGDPPAQRGGNCWVSASHACAPAAICSLGLCTERGAMAGRPGLYYCRFLGNNPLQSKC